jgi:hypothetical protein
MPLDIRKIFGLRNYLQFSLGHRPDIEPIITPDNSNGAVSYEEEPFEVSIS